IIRQEEICPATLSVCIWRAKTNKSNVMRIAIRMEKSLVDLVEWLGDRQVNYGKLKSVHEGKALHLSKSLQLETIGEEHIGPVQKGLLIQEGAFLGARLGLSHGDGG